MSDIDTKDSAALAAAALAARGDDEGGKLDTSVINTSAALAQKDETELAGMSFKDIEKAYGMDVPDRTDADPALTGDAPTHEIDRRIESGEATLATEEVLAAAALAATAPKPEPVAAAAAAAPAADAEATATAAAVVEPAEQVIETRDGKGKIPYSVLEAARKHAANLQSQLDEVNGKKQAEAEQAAIVGALTDEDIEALRAEFPEALVNSMIKLNNDNIDLKRQNQALQKSAALPGDDPSQMVVDIIDQDPVLAGWRDATTKTAWNRAVEIDEGLAKDPDFAGKSIGDRFDRVKELMAEEGFAVAKPVVPSGKTPAQIAQEAAAAAERAATAAAAAGTSRSHTHSDLPGGHAPAQSEQTQAEQLSTIQLEKMFEGKSPDQIDALLAKLG